MTDGRGKLLLHVYPTFAVGGAQARFAAIANRFGARWRHAIVAMDGNLGCRERLDPSLDITYPAVGIVKGDVIGNIRRFRHALVTLDPATLVTSNWGSIEWALANRLPITRHIHTEDGFGPEERTRQIPRRVWTRRIALRGRDVIVPSQTLRAMATGVWRLDASRVHYVPNGVALHRFDEAVPAVLPGEGPVIGAIAALRAEKNLARLLRAFALVRAEMPARLVLVGDGGERASLQALAQELGIAGSVIFTGYILEPASLYRALDVFALSSDTEQMPLTVLEAMAARLPVVATDVGDIRNMVADENAPFITPLDAQALAGSILTLLRDDARRTSIGMANRARAEHTFDQETMFQAWARFFDG